MSHSPPLPSCPCPCPQPFSTLSRLIHRDPTPTGTAHELPSPQALATEPPSSPHSHCRRLEARRSVRAFIFLAVSLRVAVSWVHPLTEGPRSSPLAVFLQHRTLLLGLVTTPSPHLWAEEGDGTLLCTSSTTNSLNPPQIILIGYAICFW